MLTESDQCRLVGRRHSVTDVVDARRAAEYRQIFRLGCSAPLLAVHWALFARFSNKMREDGHRSAMLPLPEVPWPRRMWVGGQLRWHRQIAKNDRLTRVTKVVSARRKSGRSGAFLLVGLQHRVLGQDLCVEEHQDIALLPAGRFDGRRDGRPASFEVVDTQSCIPTTTDLFRYSALTANAHRIHYDVDYARECEGYPNLVVHAPFLASILIHSVVRDHTSFDAIQFDYRAERPAFVGERLAIVRGEQSGSTIPLAVVAPDAGIAMSARISMAKT